MIWQIEWKFVLRAGASLVLFEKCDIFDVQQCKSMKYHSNVQYNIIMGLKFEFGAICYKNEIQLKYSLKFSCTILGIYHVNGM